MSDETAAIISLFHDLCKVNMYQPEKRNRKTPDGRWEQYDAYSIQEKFCFGGHGSKSVFLVQTFLKLTPEEAVAINCHMGAFGGDQYVESPLSSTPWPGSSMWQMVPRPTSKKERRENNLWQRKYSISIRN